MSYTREYADLDRALDDVQGLLNDWVHQLKATGAPPPPTEHLRYTRLVLHEWIANLRQHAHYDGCPPVLTIQLSTENRHIYCAVLDNSEGFDLEDYLPVQEEDVEPLPERGMGLRIIQACTNSVSYSPTETGFHRFAFSIPSDHDPWMSMQF